MMPDPTPSQSVYCYDTGRWEWIDATTGYSWDRSGFVPGYDTSSHDDYGAGDCYGAADFGRPYDY